MPGYFRTLGIPIVSGRPIERLDIETGTGAVVVSEAFTRHYWGDESPIGKRIKLNPDWLFYTIVGVARDTKAANLMRIFPLHPFLQWRRHSLSTWPAHPS